MTPTKLIIVELSQVEDCDAEEEITDGVGVAVSAICVAGMNFSVDIGVFKEIDVGLEIAWAVLAPRHNKHMVINKPHAVITCTIFARSTRLSYYHS